MELLHLIGPALGTVLSPISKYLQGRQQLQGKKMDLDHEVAMADKHIAEVEAEAKASIEVAAETTRGKTVEAAYRAFGSSIRRDQAAGDAAGVAPWALTVRALLVPFVVTAATAGLFVELLSPGDADAVVTNIFGLPYGWLFGHYMTGGFDVTRATSPAPSTPLGWDNIVELGRAKMAAAKASKDGK